MAGLTKSQARDKLASETEKIKSNELFFTYQDKEWKISPKDLQVEYDIDETIDVAYLIGRRGSFIYSARERLFLLWENKKLLTIFSYDKNKAESFINEILSQTTILEKDARFMVEKGTVKIIPEIIGAGIEENILRATFNSEIGHLLDRKNELKISKIYPKIYQYQLEPLKNQLTRIISEKIILKSDGNNFEFQVDQIAKWFEVASESDSSNKIGLFKKALAKDDKFKPIIVINPEKIKTDLEEVADKIDKEPVDAKLKMSEGRATVFVSSQNGYKLNQEKTLEMIESALYERMKVAGIASPEENSSASETLDLPIEVKKPTVSNETINNLGIKEQIGVATTSFKKSPPNRITNIKVGTSIFNGYLIKPGEEFSTLKALGDISAERGFLPELVIKEDSTKPEIGGGLCQVSTTLFRAALNSGLPITARTNHKYRVSYYEPPVGMDATIYDPSPDLKFKNDTPGYILIQAYTSGTDITFEFYGTKDGRQVTISTPVMYDVTSPGDPVYKEDASLAPGEKKQIEKAHNGAKAFFKYKVTKDGQTIFEKTFNSKYVAWRAVYLVGPGTPASNQEQSQPSPSPTPTETTASPTPTPTETTSSPTPTPTETTPAP